MRSRRNDLPLSPLSCDSWMLVKENSDKNNNNNNNNNDNNNNNNNKNNNNYCNNNQQDNVSYNMGEIKSITFQFNISIFTSFLRSSPPLSRHISTNNCLQELINDLLNLQTNYPIAINQKLLFLLFFCGFYCIQANCTLALRYLYLLHCQLIHYWSLICN